jgi:hypothetical protein
VSLGICEICAKIMNIYIVNTRKYYSLLNILVNFCHMLCTMDSLMVTDHWKKPFSISSVLDFSVTITSVEMQDCLHLEVNAIDGIGNDNTRTFRCVT